MAPYFSINEKEKEAQEDCPGRIKRIARRHYSGLEVSSKNIVKSRLEVMCKSHDFRSFFVNDSKMILISKF